MENSIIGNQVGCNIRFDRRRKASLEYTKFLDVEDPKVSDGLSVGVDLRLPKTNQKFVDEFCKLNNLQVRAETKFEWVIENSLKKTIAYINKEEDVLPDGKVLTLFENCNIPTGIGVNIPYGFYLELKSRSSNHKNKFSLEPGTIDEDYTNGFGFQIKFHKNVSQISFTKDERIGQIILHQGILVGNMIEISQNDWEKDPAIIKKKETRSGGFGSTGKV